ncbi:MAG: choice-of-anchor D domain-containing protein, partial [Gammaproteobacteria bacterium]|nr:choice-of-anchor D domain-containing protein [Gammaproteobacteria bacterium]
MHARTAFALRPLPLAIAAALLQTPASAAVVTWTNDANGVWDVASNWSSAPALPGATDDVQLNLLSATRRTISLNGGDFTVASLTSAQNLTLNFGTLTLNGASTVSGTFTQFGGTVAGTGDLTLSGPVSLVGGTHTGSGRTILQGATSITGVFGADAGRVIDNRGVITWSGGSIELNSASTGGAGRLDNAVGATIDAQGNNNLRASTFSDINDVPNMGVVNNLGLFRKSVGTGTTSVSAAFNNGGQVEIQTGTVDFSGGGSSTGDYTGAGTLRFGGGTHTLATSSDIDVGNLELGSGTLNHAGSVDVAGTTTVSSGTHNLTGVVTSLGNTLSLSGGTLNLNVASAAVDALNMSGGSLAGSGVLTVNGAASFVFGTQSGSGSTVLKGPSTVAGGLSLDAGRLLDNRGTLTWTSGAIELNASSTGGAGRLLNAAGATIDVQGNGSLRATNFGDINDLANTAQVDNSGLFRKSAGTGTTTVSAAFNNGGQVEIQTGAIDFSGGGASSGDYSGAGTLRFTGGTHTLASSSDINVGNLEFGSGSVSHAGGVTVSGTTTVSGGAHTLSGTVTSLGSALVFSGGSLSLAGVNASVAGFSMTGGTLGGSGNLTVSGDATLSFGTMSGSGRTRLDGDTTLTGLGLDAGRILDNRGTLLWTGGTINLNPNSTDGAGRFENAAGATFEARGNNSLSVTNFSDRNLIANMGRVDNAGTFRKVVGTGTTTVDALFNNSGALQVQTGTLDLTGGGTHTATSTVSIAAGTTLRLAGGHQFADLGRITSTGRLLVSADTVSGDGALNLGGVLEIAGGSLVLNSDGAAQDYTQSSGTRDGAGDLTVNGTATLSGGTLRGPGTTILANGGELTGIGVDAGHVLENRGELRWLGGTLQLNPLSAGGAGRFVNAAGAVFDARANNSITATAFSDVGLLPDTGDFTNQGTFVKSVGTGTTTVSARLVNQGAIQIDSGVLDLTGGSTHSATSTIAIGSGRTLRFGGGAHSFADIAGLTNAGTLQVTTGLVEASGALDSDGLIDITGGRLVLNDDGQTASFQISGGTLEGGGDLTVLGAATLSGGTMLGAGRTILLGNGSITGAIGVDSGRVLENRGTLTWTAGTINLNNLSTGGAGRIDNAAGALFDLQGNNSISVTSFGDRNLLPDMGVVNNAGTFRKSAGSGASSIQTGLNNTGAVEVSSGTLDFSDVVTQHSGTTLTGGTWRVSGNGSLSFTRAGAQNIVTNQGDVTLNGATASFTRINTLTDNQGAFRLLGARNFTAVGAFNNSGVLQLAGGTFNAPSLTNNVVGQRIGEIFGFGTVTPTVLNHGLVRASGGLLTMTGGIDGQSGTIQVDAGATLALGANSDGDLLINNGTLALGSSNVTVAQDYQNGGFGVGNAFDARANVTGSGQILAAGNVTQALTGDVTNGTGASAQLAFGNIHVGEQVTKNFAVANTGSTGPALRGALQTNVNGGNLTDARLSGSGVTAGNFGPIAAGASSTPFSVTLTGASAGALGGQAVAVVNNFDNVAEQVLSISGAVFRYANPTAHTPEPVVFANRRVGDSASQLLSITNDVPNDGFSESLDASIGGATGNATTNGGSFSLLAAGGTNASALAVGIDTSSAGHKTGTATITLTSNGEGTSGLGTTALGTQTVNVSGDVYRLAEASAHTPEPVVFANRHVGAAATQALSLTNTAANDGFSERLNASIGAGTGDVSTNGGSFSLLGAGQTNNGSLTVSLDTSSAGAKSGTATIALASDGAGTSGFGALSLGTQTVNVSGNVYRFAEASAHSPEPIVFANRHVGSAASQTLSLSNLAAADGFSESLDASIGGATGNATTNGGGFNLLAAGGTNASALAVGIDTSSAGHKVGTATITLTSNGAGTSDLGTTGLGTQTVNVSGNVYRFAEASAHSPEPIVFANRHVGSAASQTLSLSNLAAADGFSESLDASIGGATGNATTNGGSFSLLAAGGTNASSLEVGIDTSSAGHKVGTATITLTSNGAGTSGLGTTGLG